jgi:hypothetical protein
MMRQIGAPECPVIVLHASGDHRPRTRLAQPTAATAACFPAAVAPINIYFEKQGGPDVAIKQSSDEVLCATLQLKPRFK